MKVMVMGYKRHGKDTFCELLRDKYGISFAASSEFACELFLFDKIKDELGYSTPQEAFEDRGNHRKRWYNEIKDFNVKNGLSALGTKIFEKNDIYCGIRDDEEFYSLKQDRAFDVAVWIDASDRLPPEDKESNKLNISMADIVISNNGTLRELEHEVDKFYNRFFAPKLETEEDMSY